MDQLTSQNNRRAGDWRARCGVQLALPTEVTPTEVVRKTSLGGAISLCVEASGLEIKQVLGAVRADKGQFSRWVGGTEGVVWPKLDALMGACGNHAPLLWMAHAAGYDLSSMRQRESLVETQLRQAQEEIHALRRALVGMAGK